MSQIPQIHQIPQIPQIPQICEKISFTDKEYKKIIKQIPLFWYLLERSWFVYQNNESCKKKLLEVVHCNLGKYVNVVNGDFEEHLSKLLSDYYAEKIYELNVQGIC